ncbi:MAG: hypothetical protein GF372_05050 [Candidatus Marinimicrobia bacterium]|nr:hypothetical protein [Candidatus Neomarinimicrobiota bacterium]
MATDPSTLSVHPSSLATFSNSLATIPGTLAILHNRLAALPRTLAVDPRTLTAYFSAGVVLAELLLVQPVYQGHPQLFTGTFHKMYIYLSRSYSNCRYVCMTHAYTELTLLFPADVRCMKAGSGSPVSVGDFQLQYII